jgi:hypothetical protein
MSSEQTAKDIDKSQFAANPTLTGTRLVGMLWEKLRGFPGECFERRYLESPRENR